MSRTRSTALLATGMLLLGLAACTPVGPGPDRDAEAIAVVERSVVVAVPEANGALQPPGGVEQVIDLRPVASGLGLDARFVVDGRLMLSDLFLEERYGTAGDAG